MKKLTKEKLKEAIDNLYPAKQPESTREIIGGVNTLKFYHKNLGDDGFKRLLNNCSVITNSEGVEYIQEFVNRVGAEPKTVQDCTWK